MPHRMYHKSNLLQAILIAYWLLSSLAFGVASAGERDLQGFIEDKANQILSQRLEPRLYVVYAKVEAQAEPADKVSKTVKLPFSPIDIDAKLLDGAPTAMRDIDLRNYRFTLTLIFDDSLDKVLTTTFAEVFNERFYIDSKQRQLVIKSAKMYSATDKPNFEKNKLEADISVSKLETERQRLEGTKKEIEYQKKLNDAEKALQDEKSAQLANAAKEEKAKQELSIKAAKDDKAAIDAAIADKDKKAAADKVAAVASDKAGAAANAVPHKSPLLEALGNLQFLVIAVLALVGIVAGTFVFGTALKKAMNAVGEGIKAAGSGIGAAMSAQSEAAVAADAPVVAEAKDENPRASADASADMLKVWAPGNKDYDAFFVMVQDKIEVLNSDGRLSLRRALVDLLETESGVEVAAAVILALRPESVHLLIADLPDEPVRKLKTFLQSADAVARAKVARFEALQQFYGMIAAEEFVDSPLSKMRNLGWLTRMNNVELLSFVLDLPFADQATFLACLSPFRLTKMLEKSAGVERQKLLETIGKIGDVTEEAVSMFIAAREKASDFATRAAKVKPAVDHIQYLGDVADSLSADDQQVLLASVEKNPAAFAFLSRRFLPFSAVKACSLDIVREMFENRPVAQVATILFAADVDIQSYVLSSLPNVRSAAVSDELKVLQGKTALEQKNRNLSQRLQREVSNYMLRLAREGVLDIDKLLAASQAVSKPRIVNEQPIKTAGAA